ncbi:hypothetical protein OESDEN_18471 [Oesophagostomum dentatum]|uniref:Uncharacterized protein n=1 Tax=Oesophagostomum dentatum TaxID=61180 RepID=A0A0B1SF46_OESDE|nr:hypothetical protein OESDEN_18471 [Oesophagostomum dentatum]
MTSKKRLCFLRMERACERRSWPCQLSRRTSKRRQPLCNITTKPLAPSSSFEMQCIRTTS